MDSNSISIPESIPEDKELSFACDCDGSITLFEGVWQCDKCNFKEKVEK